MEDFERYLGEIVEPTLADFASHPASKRHAFLACVATCHSVDYLAFPHDPRTARQQFGHRSRDFKIVDEVGHAFKHVVSGSRRAPRLNANQVIRRPSARPGELTPGLSRPGDPIGGVTLDNDPTVDMLEVVKNAVVFLREQIMPAEVAATK